MIQARLIYDDGRSQAGGLELIDTWRSTSDCWLWLDIEGAVTDDIADMLRDLDCDNLAIKDASRERHPPKIEQFELSSFVLFRGISQLDRSLQLVPQQLALWIGARHFITVHRGRSVSVEHFWEEFSQQTEFSGPGDLALNLLHYASGRYLNTLLEFEERLAILEDELLSDISEDNMKELVAYRSRLRKLRRVFRYHHELAETIWREDSPYLGERDDALHHTRRDVYDRCERLSSLCNMYYELCSDLVEGHISLSSHHLNETMKILTIISAIFVPMTFMAGIYGMNFEHMPELGWRYAYFSLLGVMAVMAVSMLVVFRKIKWL